MKRPKAKEWTDEEVRVLTTMARQKSTACEIASALGRHIASVKRMSNEFCLPLAKKQTIREPSNVTDGMRLSSVEPCTSLKGGILPFGETD
ncbi:hypothetical protein [Bradyrhizobium sp. AZCC 1708]|uniref:hypothetical protein n=1 Tax=Bradyrhizobium sp. AZCC 1708 TaxID=3117015 RepID=UPI002FEEE185